MSCQAKAELDHSGRRRLLGDIDYLRAIFFQSRRNRQQQRPAAGDNDVLAADGPAVFDQGLQSTRAHDPRQGPAWKGKKQFTRASCQDQFLPANLAGTVVALSEQQTRARRSNDAGSIQERRAGAAEAVEPSLGLWDCLAGLL